MKQSKLLSRILEIASILTYLVAGIVVIALSHDSSNYDKSLLGWVLIATSLCRIFVALMEGEFTEKVYELILPLINFGFGFVVLFSSLDIQSICLFWGLLEICSSSVELVMAFKIIRMNLIYILNVLINVVEFVFGILLCVHLDEGITIHLIITGALFLAFAIEQTLLVLIEIRAEKKKNVQ